MGDMHIKDLVTKNRSRRRFFQHVTVERTTLEELIDLARISASAGNLQPLKYFLSNDPATNQIIFDHISWAGYLEDWPGPPNGERPSAYIIVLGDRTICQSFGIDLGIAAQSILLGAVEKGLGGCIIGSTRKLELSAALKIPSRYDILITIAIGKPKEQVEIEAIGIEGDIKYWRDEAGVHHVPKRSLEEIIIRL